MIGTHPVYEACHELFADYPLASKNADQGGSVRSMILMLPDEDEAGYCVLACSYGEGEPTYSLWSWPDGDSVVIDTESDATVSEMAVKAVTRGVPIPRDGSLFGWAHGGAVTALIAIYAEYTSIYPEPGWAVMPLAGTPEALWPPFTGERLWGHWSWDENGANSIVSLDNLIAENPDTVCWVDTKITLGSDCCVVKRDISTSQGHVLQSGRYVYYKTLREGKALPSVQTLLTDADKIDLAPRFQLSNMTAG